MVRLDVKFPSGGVQCAAWLYLPDGNSAAPAPVVVLAHGLGGVREMRLDAYAERFAAEGYACLVFDYRHFGASEGEPRQLLDIGHQIEDWAAAIAYVRTRPELDPDGVVVWGTSFGGGHSIVAAADDHRVAAAIAQCPFTDGLASSFAVSARTMVKITALAIADKLGSLFGRAPIMVATSGPVKSAALMTSPDAQPGYLQLVPEGPDGQRFRNEVAARFALDVVRHFPGRRTKEVRCPILFAVCETDSVAPAKATQRHARNAPKGEVRLYPDGHFDIYVGEPFERVVADQIAFLHAHVPVRRTQADPALVKEP